MAPSKKPAAKTFRAEYAVRAVLAVEFQADTMEEALALAKEKVREWPLEGIQSERCDENVKVIGVSDSRGWRVTEEQ